MTERDLAANRQALARLLRWPDNLGIRFHDVQVGSFSPADALLVWSDGLVSDQDLRAGILEPLGRYAGEPTSAGIGRALLVPSPRMEGDLNNVVKAVLSGEAALLIDRAAVVLLLDIGGQKQHQREGKHMVLDSFGTDLLVNVALIRKRLKDPRLLAFRLPLKGKDRGKIAMVYMEGRAEPSLVRLVRRWASCHLGEEAVSRGIIDTAGATIGLMPRFDSTRWPDQAATLLDSGYVVMLSDGAYQAFVAPVSAASWVTGPDDFSLTYPIKRALVIMRVALYAAVLFLPGALIALMNYHIDMVPTAFLVAFSSVRENAPFSVTFEILMLELITEVGREASFRLPLRPSPGTILVSMALFLLLAVHAGFVGPLPALTSLAGAMVSLALPSYGGGYLVRVWRFYLLGAAAILGFFGMASLFAVLLAYLCRVRRWGIPFLGPSGPNFSTPEGQAARPSRRKGGATERGAYTSGVR